jgi:hypothetical protein
MEIAAIRIPAFVLLICILAGFTSPALRAQNSQQVVFHVLHVEETSVYIDVGGNLGLKEGTTLSLFHAESIAGPAGAETSAAAKPIAQLKVLIVADSSTVCQIVSSTDEVRIGDAGFFISQAKARRMQDEALIEAKDHPISIAFADGDPRDDEVRPVEAGRPAPQGAGHTGVRIAVDYDATRVQGGFKASEVGFQIDSNMTRIAGSNWNFTGYWRSRFRQTYSGLNGVQLESLADRIDRTYHIGFYYDSPNSSIVVGIGRLSVPGAPSLPTIDGGYFGEKITHHVTWGVFGGSTPDPADWTYNANQEIAGTFTNIEAGDFSGLHFSGAEGLAFTAVHWRVARQFAFFENTVSWKRYLWFYNSTQVDAARTSPVPGAGSNGTGISFTSSSIRVQPLPKLNVGFNHSYFDSLPTFDPNLLGTSLLDKYIFQGLSLDARYELPYRISLFTQVGRSKSIADTKQMWNKMYGISFGQLFNTGFHADFRYAQFDSTFGRGNYRALSVSRNLKESFQFEFLGGSQSLVSASTANTSSHFVTGSVTWSLGPRYFFQTGYTWSRGISMNYQQWNTMFGYRFGSFRAR